MNPESKEINKAKITAFDRFSAYHEFYKEGLTVKFTKPDVLNLLNTNNSCQERLVKRSVDLKNNKRKLNVKEDQTSMPQSIISNINILDFQKEVMDQINNLTNLFERTEEQKKNILFKSEGILNEHISRAERGEINISSYANPLKNAMAIIYAVLVSNENMPNINQIKLSKIAGINHSAISQLYNKYYRILAQKLNFDFQSAKLGRNVISLYFFELLMDTDIDTPKIVVLLRNIIINTHILGKHELLEQLTEKEINSLQNMVNYYSNTFNKYFTDLVNIIKLLIISNKSHKIISADFSVKRFAMYLMDRKINLFLGQYQFVDVIGKIFNFLSERYPKLFSDRTHTIDNEKREDAERTTVIGSRIKLYILRHI